LIKFIMPTTSLRNLSEGMPDYWDVNPPNTESTKYRIFQRQAPMSGRGKDCSAGETKVEVFDNTLLENWLTKRPAQQLCWECLTVGLKQHSTGDTP
jgi:hypothetical protein